jgi:signal transduction histidine kinase
MGGVVVWRVMSDAPHDVRVPRRSVTGMVTAVVAVGVLAEGLDGPTLPATSAMVVSGLLALFALVFADARPIWAFTAATVSLIVSATFGVISALRPEHTFGTLEFLLLSTALLRTIMLHPPRRVIVAAGAVAVAIGALPRRLLDHPRDAQAVAQDGPTQTVLIGLLTLWVLLVAMFGLYLGLLERRRADADRLRRQAERLDHARDLHDFIAHHVTAIVAQTRAIRYVTQTGSAPPTADLDALHGDNERSGIQALASTHTLVNALRDDTPRTAVTHRNLDDMLTAVAADFPAVGPALSVHVDDDLATRRLPADSLDAIHHTVLEALTNVLRHTTDTTTVAIRIRPANQQPNLAEVTVTNDGKPAATALPAGGFGLAGLAERVAALGGHLTAGPFDTGWRVTARVPLVRTPATHARTPAA